MIHVLNGLYTYVRTYVGFMHELYCSSYSLVRLATNLRIETDLVSKSRELSVKNLMLSLQLLHSGYASAKFLMRYGYLFILYNVIIIITQIKIKCCVSVI